MPDLNTKTLKALGLYSLTVLGYSTTGPISPWILFISSLLYAGGLVGGFCPKMNQFFESSLPRDAIRSTQPQMGAAKDAAQFAKVLKGAGKDLNPFSFRQRQAEYIRALGEVARSKEGLDTCTHGVGKVYINSQLHPYLFQLKELQKSTLQECTTSCSDYYSKALIQSASLAREFGANEYLISNNVTLICGECCVHSITEGTNAITEQLTTEVGDSIIRGVADDLAATHWQKGFFEVLNEIAT